MKTSILDVSGKQMVAIQGPHSFKTFERGQLTVELLWVDEEPHMMLYRSNRGGKTGSYLIDINDMHRYANSQTGGPSPSLRMDVVEAIDAMGFDRNDKHAIFDVMSAILDHIPDLKDMPPEPKASEIANRPVNMGDELAIKINGKTVAEFTV